MNNGKLSMESYELQCVVRVKNHTVPKATGNFIIGLADVLIFTVRIVPFIFHPVAGVALNATKLTFQETKYVQDRLNYIAQSHGNRRNWVTREVMQITTISSAPRRPSPRYHPVMLSNDVTTCPRPVTQLARMIMTVALLIVGARCEKNAPENRQLASRNGPRVVIECGLGKA